MKIEKEQEEQIINFGVFEYNAKKMASILGVSEREIQEQLDDDSSEMAVLVQKGKDMADYVIDKKLFDLARNGDIKALEKLDSRIEYRKRARK